MFKSTAVALTLASVVFAQSATQSAASGIPTGISAQCNTFLTQLDANPDINSCVGALIDATADFDPSSTTTPSASSITTTLNTLCAANFGGCQSTTIRGLLANFYTACQTEMLGAAGDGSNGNQGVIDIYDVLYLLTPLKGAICTKDNGQFCVTTMSHNGSSNSTTTNNSGTNNGGSSDTPAANGSNSSAAPSDTSAPASSGSQAPSSSVAPSSSGSASSSAHSTSATHARRAISPNALYKRTEKLIAARGEGDQNTIGDIAPDASTYNSQGLPYLFITPNITDTAQLCTPCVSRVIGSYISFESITPYALGIPHSPMLSGQVALWDHIKTTCPTEFTAGLLSNATITRTDGNDDSSDALISVRVGGFTSLVGAAVVAVVGAWLF